MLENCEECLIHQMDVPVQMAFDKLEKWANRNLMKFNDYWTERTELVYYDFPFQIFCSMYCDFKIVDFLNILTVF